MARGKNRMSNEINAGSMADIAFLLLIFFLVTTTIAEDKGVLVGLPIWSDEVPETLHLKKRNVFPILVNADDQLLVRGELAELRELREHTKDFILNPKNDEEMAESPTKAIVSIQNDRGTKYGTYLSVYNEIKAAYRELWDSASNKKYGKNYEFLNGDQQKKIRADIPLVISEADPTEYGDEE